MSSPGRAMCDQPRLVQRGFSAAAPAQLLQHQRPACVALASIRKTLTPCPLPPAPLPLPPAPCCSSSAAAHAAGAGGGGGGKAPLPPGGCVSAALLPACLPAGENWLAPCRQA